jgi:hypothetical protein
MTKPAAPTEADPNAIMRPKNNAGGDFWGPVVQRMIQQYLLRQRAGGLDSSGFTGDKSSSPTGYGGYGGRGGEPTPMG